MSSPHGSGRIPRIDTFLAHHTEFLAHTDTTSPANTECPICLEDMLEHICVKIVDIQGCSHMIGLECLETFLNSHPYDKKLCPLCRTEWLNGPGPDLVDEPDDADSDIHVLGDFDHQPVYGDATRSQAYQNLQVPSYLGPRMHEYLNGAPRGGSRQTRRTPHVAHGQRVPAYTFNGGPNHTPRGPAHGSRANQQTSGPRRQVSRNQHGNTTPHHQHAPAAPSHTRIQQAHTAHRISPPHTQRDSTRRSVVRNGTVGHAVTIERGSRRVLSYRAEMVGSPGERGGCVGSWSAGAMGRGDVVGGDGEQC